MTAPAPVGVSFVSGDDGWSKPPALARMAGLARRMAVIQDSHVPGWPDMVFDEALWRRLVALVQSAQPSCDVSVRTRDNGPDEVLDVFLTRWDSQPPDDRDPPRLVVLSRSRKPVLVMATDYWTRIGGPAPYADSYTYVIYAAEGFGQALPASLASAPEAARWRIDPHIHPAVPRPRGLWRWILGRLS